MTSINNEDKSNKTQVMFVIEEFKPEVYKKNESGIYQKQLPDSNMNAYCYYLDNEMLVSRDSFKATFQDIKLMILSQNILFVDDKIKIKNTQNEEYEIFSKDKGQKLINFSNHDGDTREVDFYIKIDAPQTLLQYLQVEKEKIDFKSKQKKEEDDKILQNKKKFDILFIKGEPIDADHLQSDLEIKKMIKILSTNKKQAEIRIATKFNQIKDYVKKYQLQIIHIGCHIIHNKQNGYYSIQLESADHKLKEYKAAEFGQIFYHTQHNPQLLFLNCCHSEAFYEQIKQNLSGLNIICVDKDYKIKDRIAVKFMEQFYELLFTRTVLSLQDVFYEALFTLSQKYIEEKKFKLMKEKLFYVEQNQCTCMKTIIDQIVKTNKDKNNCFKAHKEILKYGSQFFFYHDGCEEQCQFEPKLEDQNPTKDQYVKQIPNKDHQQNFQYYNLNDSKTPYKLINTIINFLSGKNYSRTSSDIQSIRAYRNEHICDLIMYYLVEYCEFFRYKFFGGSNKFNANQLKIGYPYISKGFYYQNLLLDAKRDIKKQMEALEMSHKKLSNRSLICYIQSQVKQKQIAGKYLRYKFEEKTQSLSLVTYFRTQSMDQLGDIAILQIKKCIEIYNSYKQNELKESKKTFYLFFQYKTQINNEKYDTQKKQFEDQITELNIQPQIYLTVLINNSQEQIEDDLEVLTIYQNIMGGIKKEGRQLNLNFILDALKREDYNKYEAANKDLLQFMKNEENNLKFSKYFYRFYKRLYYSYQEKQEKESQSEDKKDQEKNNELTKSEYFLGKIQLTKQIIKFFIEQKILKLSNDDLQYLLKQIEDRQQNRNKLNVYDDHFNKLDEEQKQACKQVKQDQREINGSLKEESKKSRNNKKDNFSIYSFNEFQGYFNNGYMYNKDLSKEEKMILRELIKSKEYIENNREIMYKINLLYLEDLSKLSPNFKQSLKEDKMLEIIENYNLNGIKGELKIQEIVQFVRECRILKTSQLNPNMFSLSFLLMINSINDLSEAQNESNSKYKSRKSTPSPSMKKTISDQPFYENQMQLIHTQSESKGQFYDIQQNCLGYLKITQQIQIIYNYYNSIDEETKSLSYQFFTKQTWYIQQLFEKKIEKMKMSEKIVYFCCISTILNIIFSLILQKDKDDRKISFPNTFSQIISTQVDKIRRFEVESQEFKQKLQEFKQKQNGYSWQTFIQDFKIRDQDIKVPEYEYEQIINNWINYFKDQYISIEANYEEFADIVKIDQNLMKTLSYEQLFNIITQADKDYKSDEIWKILSRICVVQYYCTFGDQKQFLNTKNTCQEIDEILKKNKIRALFQFSTINQSSFLKKNEQFDDLPQILIIDEQHQRQIQDGYIYVQQDKSFYGQRDIHINNLKKINNRNIKLIFIFSNSKSYIDFFEQKYHIIYLDDSIQSQRANKNEIYEIFKLFIQSCLIQLVKLDNSNKIGSLFQSSLRDIEQYKFKYESNGSYNMFMNSIQFKSQMNSTDVSLRLLSSQNQQHHFEHIKNEITQQILTEIQEDSFQIDSYLQDPNLKTIFQIDQDSKVTLDVIKQLIQYIQHLYCFKESVDYNNIKTCQNSNINKNEVQNGDNVNFIINEQVIPGIVNQEDESDQPIYIDLGEDINKNTQKDNHINGGEKNQSKLIDQISNLVTQRWHKIKQELYAITGRQALKNISKSQSEQKYIDFCGKDITKDKVFLKFLKKAYKQIYVNGDKNREEEDKIWDLQKKIEKYIDDIRNSNNNTENNNLQIQQDKNNYNFNQQSDDVNKEEQNDQIINPEIVEKIQSIQQENIENLYQQLNEEQHIGNQQNNHQPQQNQQQAENIQVSQQYYQQEMVVLDVGIIEDDEDNEENQ